MSDTRILRSPSVRARLDAATAWLSERGRARPLLVVSAHREAGRALIRSVSRDGATFGWRATTLPRLAADRAAHALLEDGRGPASALSAEAVCWRTVSALRDAGGLGRYADVADTPGLPRALAATLMEARLAGLEPEDLPEDLAAIARRFRDELAASGLADRADVFRLAAEGAPIDEPVLWLDVRVRSLLEERLVTAISSTASHVLATVAAGDEESRSRLARALVVDTIEDLGSPVGGALGRAQDHLFEDRAPEPASADPTFELMSAPGEGREAVEIARRIGEAAAGGIPFDRMAVLLHAETTYRTALGEALERADIPAWFARGTRRPDPAGRALAALLACRADGYSASRFSEYLSLGEVPAPTEDGAPPEALPRGDRFAAPGDEMFGATADDASSDDESPPAVFATPRRWEKLIVDAAVIGDLDRWRRRLAGLAAELGKKHDALDEDAEGARAALTRRREDLERLQAFALPLLEDLASWSGSAPWSEWIDRISALATRAVRRPGRIFNLLGELEPLRDAGSVTLEEVRLVLEHRLLHLDEAPPKRRFGRVMIAPIDAARGLAFDVVFVPGLAERVFPRKLAEDPILLDARREALPELATATQRAADERLALRLAVGAATSRCVLSWSRIDTEQVRPRVPSFYGLEAVRASEGVLPSFDELSRRAETGGGARIGWPAPEDPARAIDEAEHDLALLDAALAGGTSATRGAASYLTGANAHLARALRARYARWREKRVTAWDGLVKPRVLGAEALVAHRLASRSFSPTALQKFADCPYAFMLYTVLRLRPREVPEAIEDVDPLTRGSIVHEVLEKLMNALRDAGALPVTAANIEAARSRLDATLDEEAARWREVLYPAIPRVWDDAIESMRADLREALRRMSEEKTWHPAWFELSFGLGRQEGRDEGSRADDVELDCGLRARGSIDLVETSGDRVRVTDYKTGRVRFGRDAIIEGGAVLQPALYALVAEKMFPERRISGGRLWYCTHAGGFESREVPLDRQTRQAVDTVARVVGDRLENGLLPASPRERACRWCDFKPVCGPHEEFRSSRKDASTRGDLDGLRRLT